mmetsp:Transcript_5421/g.13384  ORF Transcript_5421/g.13384 Transcript_5421/m.13384 type:complete len:115 (-) Transcript_5421:160-504(-)
MPMSNQSIVGFLEPDHRGHHEFPQQHRRIGSLGQVETEFHALAVRRIANANANANAIPNVIVIVIPNVIAIAIDSGRYQIPGADHEPPIASLGRRLRDPILFEEYPIGLQQVPV